MFTYFEDVDEDDGCTTLVPGSNALTFDPRHAFRMQTDGKDMHELAEQVRNRPQSGLSLA